MIFLSYPYPATADVNSLLGALHPANAVVMAFV